MGFAVGVVVGVAVGAEVGVAVGVGVGVGVAVGGGVGVGVGGGGTNPQSTGPTPMKAKQSNENNAIKTKELL